MLNGYEYEVVGRCPKTGKDRVAPISWYGNQAAKGSPGQRKPETVQRADRPVYSTCTCCPERPSSLKSVG